MRNPFSHHSQEDPRLHPGATQEQVDAAYTELGWATKIEREIPRADGEPLVFRCRMPTGIRLVDVADLVAAAQDAPVWIDNAWSDLHAAAEQAGVVVVGAVVSDESPTDVLATLTVVFSEQVTDPRVTIREPGPDEKVKQHVVQLADNCTMVDRMTAVPQGPDGKLIPLIVNQYLWRTDYGGLVMAFSTMHAGMGSDQATHFFVETAKNAQLVPASAPAG